MCVLPWGKVLAILAPLFQVSNTPRTHMLKKDGGGSTVGAYMQGKIKELIN